MTNYFSRLIEWYAKEKHVKMIAVVRNAIMTREIMVYIPQRRDTMEKREYLGRQVLVAKEFVSDMGFSGYVRRPIGLIVEMPTQLYDKKGKKSHGAGSIIR